MRFFLFLLGIAHLNIVAAQNLVQNGSFEDHIPLTCQSCHLRPENFANIMKSWRNLNTNNPFICDCQYKKNRDEEISGICLFDKVQPYDGCTMMELNYLPSCSDFKHQTQGCASYLATKLAKPLSIGETYEVSFWVYIMPPYEPEYLQHLGISLYTEVIRNPNGAMLEGSDFLLDTIIYNSWYQAKWHVRPLCGLQFLAIGVFRGENGPPVNGKGNRNLYYIDQVSVKKLESNQLLADSATQFCKYKKKKEEILVPEIKGGICYFEIGDSIISQVYKASLDSFAIRAKLYPKASFLVTGHTDSFGNNNVRLSMARVESVLRYLEETHRLPRARFISYGVGSKEPTSPNNTPEGRRLNRRVEIRQTDHEIQDVIYRNVLEQIFDGRNEEAINALYIWMRFAEDKDKMLMLFDPRLNSLKKDKKWASLIKQVKKSYSNYKQPEMVYALDSLWAEDQKSRTLKYYIENLAAYLYDIDERDSRWDVLFSVDLGSEAQTDKEHYDVLLKLIGKKNYPKSSEIGERPSKAVFLIINHTMDTAILSHFIPLVENRCKEGEADWLFYATMYDRLMILKGKPQRFGTQYRQISGGDGNEKHELFPLEDSRNLNNFRKSIGLEPLNGFD